MPSTNQLPRLKILLHAEGGKGLEQFKVLVNRLTDIRLKEFVDHIKHIS